MKKTYVKPTAHVVKLQQHNLICGTMPPDATKWSGELDSRGTGEWDDENNSRRRNNVWDEEEEF